jgi:tRNA modification GTPase
MYDTRDTIVAIASAPGGAARAIVRLSGSQTVSILERCFRASDAQDWAKVTTPTAVAGSLRLTQTRVALPADLYLWPGPRSYTREPLAELHTLGSPPLASALLGTLCENGARLAAPGEFTMRAFLAGRLDLAQAEAVMGVVDARGAAELTQALAQLAGGIARPLATVRDHLLDLLAELEAGLDFVEEDLEFISRDELERGLCIVSELLNQIESQFGSRERHDAPPRVTLVGLPNVGKSSLFNALASGARALVSEQAGTTRDYLAITLDLDGARCQLIDTAGAAVASDPISLAAQLAMSEQSDASELRLLCIDASRSLDPWEQRELATNRGAREMLVLTKCDRPRQVQLSCPALQTSAETGSGLDSLKSAIAGALAELARAAEEACPAAQQCVASVRAASESMGRARRLAHGHVGDELVAAEVRAALAELGKVAGAVYTDDLLDRVFSRFCIGK